MRQEDKLKEKVGKKLPYKVPEGYFESFTSRMMESLPEYPAKPVQPKLSKWQRIKPYVYLAAMFAGIWCMMQIFHRVSKGNQNPDQYAHVIQTPASFDMDYDEMYIDNTLGTDLEIQDEVTDLYPTIDDFKRDFYAAL